MKNSSDYLVSEDYMVGTDATMAEVIEVIGRGSAQIALVVDENCRLLGTVTDGDFRRALLRGLSMQTLVEQFMHFDFRSISSKATDADALSFMQHERIHQLPALDHAGQVVRLFRLEDLIKPMERLNTVVIMAGGKGERLKHLTRDCPKPMLLVRGKPILEIILEQCIEVGFREFYFSVNYLKEHIKDYFGDGAFWKVNIQYLEEDKPLGTAGALSLLPSTLEHPLLVLNGDVLTRVDYGRLLRFHSEHLASATLCVQKYTTRIPYGVVRMNDVMVQQIDEKPVFTNYVNAGIYLLEPGLLELVPTDQFFDMPQLLENALEQQYSVSAFPIYEYWLDVGLPETFEQANGEWK
jgi:dTDP-glucose pyrophosphorylase/CBS domain-containing protein